MTRLLIDGHDVVLPLNMTIDYFRENPFFSKNGEYTYDIDIDLDCPQNRILYASIDRQDVTKRLAGRQAVLLDGYRVIVKGTEVVLAVEDKKAKIQIVAGNSELNYLSGGGKRLREMDLGELSVTREQAYYDLSKIYPEAACCCPPIYTSYNDTSQFKFDNQMDITSGSTVYQSDTYISPQPYLLYVFDKVIQALGYIVTDNALLDEERWCRLFLVNGYRTTKLAEMLPDWSVDEFLTEMEKFFNCVLIVNQGDKTVQILRTDGYYNSVDKVYIDKVLDEQSKKDYDVSEDLYISYRNVRYDFPSLERYKYQCLSEDVLKHCNFVDIDTHLDYMGLVQSNACTIYHSLDYNLHFAGGKMVNRFAPISDGTDEDVVSLKVIPAEIFTGMTGAANETTFVGLFTAPYARNMSSEDKTTEAVGFKELVTEGVPQADVPSNLYVALYMGWQGIFVDSTEPTAQYQDYQLPMSTVDVFNYGDYVHGVHTSFGVQKFRDSNMTLCLQGENGLYEKFYKNNVKVNTKTEYTFKFLAETMMDTKAIFVIRNKEYYCKELHNTVSTEKMDKVVEGTFYLVEES